MDNFKKLNLQIGDLIYIQNEKGEGFTGTFQNEYNSSNETFMFENHSSGNLEKIKVKNIQYIKKN